jgi:hypothetical protein
VTKQGQRVMGIWQKGFSDHRLRDFEDYEHHRRYIHFNPVKAGLSNNPQEYPYSSANPRYKLDPIPQRLKPLNAFAEVRRS